VHLSTHGGGGGGGGTIEKDVSVSHVLDFFRDIENATGGGHDSLELARDINPLLPGTLYVNLG
jgi:hypothetical protein